jgi:hypothetical protein
MVELMTYTISVQLLISHAQKQKHVRKKSEEHGLWV